MAGRRRGGAPRPPHTRHRTARPAGATPLPPAPPPPPGPPLAPAVPQPAGRTREPTEEQVHCLRDPRVLPGDAEIGEDEQAPVRRDVLGPVQFERRGAGRVPLAPGMLLAKDLRSPSPPADLPPRAQDLRVVLGPVEELAEDAGPDARIRLFLQGPVPDPAGDAQGAGDPAAPYIVSN